MAFRCVLHGSFSKHFAEIQQASAVFRAVGIEVLAPKLGELVDSKNGFGLFEDEIDGDPRLVELLYLHHIKQLGEQGFSYFVNPEGYIGKSASYELGIAQLTNVPCYFMNKLADHPAYMPHNMIWPVERLANFVVQHRALPVGFAQPNEQRLQQLWEDLIVPGSVVAAGAIIEHQPHDSRQEKEILLVKTHKWGGRYSIVGGKVRRNERLHQALLREVREETGLRGTVGSHICTFDQLKNSGYYRQAVQHIFVDNIVQVASKNVILNDEAQDYLWALPSEALRYLDIEPNARKTVELYAASQ